jgi:hypothetical protein
MRAVAALLTLTFVSTTALAGEPASLTRSEVRSLSDQALARRIFGPLASDMSVSNRTNRNPRLWGPEIIWFWTRPRRSWTPGVCETDRIIVHLEPGLPSQAGGDRSLRLHGLVVQTYFIVQNRELARRLTGIDPREMEGLDVACAALDPRRDGIPADDSGQLMKALSLISELGEAARAGRTPAPLDCSRMNWNGDPPVDEAACLRELAILRENQVGWVAGCAEAVVFETNCIRVLSSDWFIYFLYRPDQRLTRIIVRGIEDTSAIE